MKKQSYFLNIVLDKGDCLNNLAKFLDLDNGQNYLKVSNLTTKNVVLKNRVTKSYFPKSFESTTYPNYLKDLSLSKLLLWYSCQIITFSNRIEKFLDFKTNFENLFLTRQYLAAENVLRDVEAEFGMSLWLLENYAILDEFQDRVSPALEKLDIFSKSFYFLFRGKNNKKEQTYTYRNRMNECLNRSKISNHDHAYYRYKLFINTPSNEEDWKHILLCEGKYSLIDIYISLVDCLQYYFAVNTTASSNYCLDLSYKLMSELSCPICKNMHYIRSKSTEKLPNCSEFSSFIDAFDNQDFDKVVKIFFSNDFKFYNVFTAYRFVATSLLVANKEPEKTNELLCNEIVLLIYNILKKDDIEVTKESIQKLTILTRVLKTFSIHKGMCIFLRITTNNNSDYLINQQYNTFGYINLINYELCFENYALLPYKCIYSETNKQSIENSKRILCQQKKESPSYGYFKEANYRLIITDLIKRNLIEEATTYLVESYIDGMFLIYTMATDKIYNNVKRKINEDIPLTIDELCYVFIDNELEEEKRDCLLNFLDDNKYSEPLEVRNTNSSDKILNFFLYSICDISMLSKIYWMVNSIEETKEYRLKICTYLLTQNKFKNNRHLVSEAEDLTKTLELKKRLIDVDKSRVSIDVRDIIKRTYTDISMQVDAYNNSDPEQISFNGIVINPREYIFNTIYSTYAKQFCFGNSGIDTSLSTRVRHGALPNQILRPFSDNSLSYDICEKNTFFNELIKKEKTPDKIIDCVLLFNQKINDILNYLTQHTLKVFIDNPIEGAVFDYNITEKERISLYNKISKSIKITTEEIISIINHSLILKTNAFLSTIKEYVLPEFLKNLTDECDIFLKEITPLIKNSASKREISKKVADCKVALQSEIKTIKEWFSLNDFEKWENFSFDDLIDMCVEIEKKLFSSFEMVTVNRLATKDFIYKGSIFRQCIDIIIMLFNNAIQHSGFKGQLQNLQIDCLIDSDNHSIYLIVENNLSASVNIEELKTKIETINNNYNQSKYLTINTRQEGGMGLLKVMFILYSATNTKDLFFISINDDKFRVEIKINKEIILYDESFNS